MSIRGVKWYRASGGQATFAFMTRGERVEKVAPYGRNWLHGKSIHEARRLLAQRGYTIERLRGAPDESQGLHDQG